MLLIHAVEVCTPHLASRSSLNDAWKEAAGRAVQSNEYCSAFAPEATIGLSGFREFSSMGFMSTFSCAAWWHC